MAFPTIERQSGNRGQARVTATKQMPQFEGIQLTRGDRALTRMPALVFPGCSLDIRA